MQSVRDVYLHANGRGRGVLKILLGALLAACLCTVLAGSVTDQLDVRDAVDNLHGLTLWVTIPYDHYGPGQPIKVYLTFTNRGSRTVYFQQTAPVFGVFTVDGKLMTFPQRGDSSAAQGPSSRDTILPLAPGAHWLRTVVLEPERREFIHGKYPLKIYCLLDNAYEAPAPGVERRALKGTLVSNTVTVKIKYKVIMVY